MAWRYRRFCLNNQFCNDGQVVDENEMLEMMINMMWPKKGDIDSMG